MNLMTRIAIVLFVSFVLFTPARSQIAGVLESEVSYLDKEKIILVDGQEFSVMTDDEGNYGPFLDNYPMLLRVGYIELARLHVVEDVVVQIEVLKMLQ